MISQREMDKKRYELERVESSKRNKEALKRSERRAEVAESEKEEALRRAEASEREKEALLAQIALLTGGRGA